MKYYYLADNDVAKAPLHQFLEVGCGILGCCKETLRT